ncbi:MAG TPA: methylaspartate mutase subunit S [Dehalococcoidia bacterium]|jgi:methylaspartate mutase sigma subunit|nr:methylaspartate mutase subunit S [Dehalococcoidia bacterium]
MGQPQITIITGVLRDIHHLGIKVVGYALQEAGFRPVFIGARLEQEEFIQAAIETDAKAIFMSSSNGHAELDAVDMREKCTEVGLGNILLYLGGNLVIAAQEQDWTSIEGRFKEMGYDRVYPPGVSPAQVIQDLKADLAQRYGISEVARDER